MGAHGKQCTCKTCLVVWHLGPVKRTRKTRKKGAEEWCPLHAKVPEMRVLLELLTKDHLNDNGECQFFHVGRRRRKVAYHAGTCPAGKARALLAELDATEGSVSDEHELIRDPGQGTIMVGECVFYTCKCGARVVKHVVSPGTYQTVRDDHDERKERER